MTTQTEQRELVRNAVEVSIPTIEHVIYCCNRGNDECPGWASVDLEQEDRYKAADHFISQGWCIINDGNAYCEHCTPKTLSEIVARGNR